MLTFSFVSSAQLRELLERDYAEMLRCLEFDANKSTVLLAGSIIEACLVDHFMRFRSATNARTDAQLLRMDLNELLDTARDEHLLSTQTLGMCHAIRGYRNLIHPGVELRRQRGGADKDIATVCVHLVNIISKELSNVFADKAGYSADIALALFVDDPTSESRADLVLSAMDQFEKQRFFQNLPSTIVRELESAGWSARGLRLARIHQRIKDQLAPEDIEREIASLRTLLFTNSPIQIATRIALFSRELRQTDAQTRDALANFVVDAFRRADLPLIRTLAKSNNLNELAPLLEPGNRLRAIVDELHTKLVHDSKNVDELLSEFGVLTSGLDTNSIEQLKQYAGTLWHAASVERLQIQIGVPF